MALATGEETPILPLRESSLSHSATRTLFVILLIYVSSASFSRKRDELD